MTDKIKINSVYVMFVNKKRGDLTLEQVPEKYRAEVQAKLEG